VIYFERGLVARGRGGFVCTPATPYGLCVCQRHAWPSIVWEQPWSICRVQ